MNRRFFLTMVGKAGIFFAVFNLLFLVAQPLENPHLTLYNRLFPGRLRLAWSDQPDSGLVSETVLTRLVADHALSRPKADDEYRIIVLGASETFGYRLRAQDSMPVLLDSMGLRAPDGRQVRVYNLSYVFADAFKDMLILKTALETGTQPDLILLAINIYTFAPPLETHWLAESNPDLALELIEQYDIESVPREPLVELVNARPFWWRHSFLAQRSDVAAWLVNQVYGVAWWAVGEGDPTAEVTPGVISSRVPFETHLTRTDVLDALAQLAQEHGVPLALVDMPVNFINPQTYTAWIEEQTAALQIPRLACSDLLPPREFIDTRFHFGMAGHRAVAEQVAVWLAQYWENMPLLTTCPDGTGA